MNGHHAVLISNRQEAERLLAEVGASPAGIEFMIPKGVFRCIKLKKVSNRAANIIKQEMLSKGGEAAVAKEALIGDGEHDMLLLGTARQYQRLLEKLRMQPFGLKNIAREIEIILTNLEISAWNIELANGRQMEFGTQTKIMGILNITPDSFSDGGRFFDPDKAIARALEMAEEGADIIDIGGASSRPDSQMIDEMEELRRILPVVEKLAGHDLIVSVDTFRARVAEAVLEAGAHLINNIGLFTMDPDLLEVVSRRQAPVVLMHNRLQINPRQTYGNLIDDIMAELQQAIAQAEAAGLAAEKIIIDPGLGFGMTHAQSMMLLKRLQDFRSLGRPILIGASRKRFIGNALDLDIQDRLEGSIAAAVIGVINGASILRVHDVLETKRAVQMADAVRLANG